MPLDSGGRSYGATVSSPTRMIRPEKPASRAASAALAPARLAPMIARVRVVVMRDLLCSVCSSRPHAREGKELRPGPRVLAQEAVQRGGHRSRSVRLHPAEGHAQVLGL